MDATPEFWNWPNFTPAELQCRHTGTFAMNPAFLDKLQAFRTHLRFPLVITSGYRHPSHPIEQRKAQPGSHSFGRAVDIAVYGERALAIVEQARLFGFTGIGASQLSGASRFIHLDDMGADYHAPRPAFWTY